MKNIDKRYLNKGIDNFRKSMILVLGDIMLDRFIWGKVSRISPEAPVPVVEVEHETAMLGGATNVVNNLISLGANVMMCGVLGDDPTGNEIISQLHELNVDTAGIAIEPDRSTSVKTRIIAHDQQVVRYDRENKIPLKPKSAKGILDFIHKKKGNLSAIIVSDYGKGVISRQLLNGLKNITSDYNVPVTVDPYVKNFPLYKDVTVITPNHTQAGEIAGLEISTEEDLEYLNRTELRYDDYFLHFYNFNPESVVHSDRNACDQDVDYFVVHKSGKCVINSVKGAQFDSIQKGPALYVNKLRYTGSGVFISEIERALKSGVKVKNCYACRYHADAHYSLFESKPIFCKTYKFKCRSNHAAECDRYRPDIKIFENHQERAIDVFLDKESYKIIPKPIPTHRDEIYKMPDTIICSKCGKSTKDWVTLNPDVCSDCIYGRK